MAITDDVLKSTNEWIDLLINGDESLSIIGLQARMDAEYPDKNIVVEFAGDGYLLPRDSNFGRELEHPFVAITCRFRYDSWGLTYWKSKLPKSEDIGWSEDLSIRFDVWGRTPPETRDVADAVHDSLRVMKPLLWDNARAQLKMQVEVENYVDKLEGVPDLFHRSQNIILTVFKKKEVD